MPKIGIIGGSGLYQLDGFTNTREEKINTPFGDPSDAFIIGELEGKEVAFLPRHGRGHKILPTELNHRANMWAFKTLGVETILSFSAVGSLRIDYKPQDFVVIDQFFDRTYMARPNTFFGNGIVAHIQFAKPLCEDIRQILIKSGKAIGATIHESGTYVNMEGPQFSTLAESQLYKSWGMAVIGMTNMTEARLAREAEICYATVATVTDYDCWHEAETGETVSVEMVLENLHNNIDNARKLVKEAVKNIPDNHSCACHSTLAGAIMTDKSLWPQETKQKLEPIIKKYL